MAVHRPNLTQLTVKTFSSFSENPLFVENQKNAIDLDGWFNNHESQDDDDEIDDNAVDDSAIALNSDVSW